MEWNVYGVGTRHTIHQAFIQKSFNYSIVCGEPTEKVCACVREGGRERETAKAKVGFLNSAQAIRTRLDIVNVYVNQPVTLCARAFDQKRMHHQIINKKLK